MKKIIFSMLALLAWAASLSAQITREQADAIVLDYLKNEGVQADILYINDKEPAEEGITLTTSNEETIRAKYACWVYYLSERDPAQSRYLFVKEDNGSLLEIIAGNDLGPGDLAAWQVVGITTGLTDKEGSAKLLYPNPVNDWLTLPCNGEYTRVEIRDLKGTRLFSGWLSGQDACQLNVSFLSAGVYMVSVEGESFKIIKN